MLNIYLRGRHQRDTGQLSVPQTSCAVIFILRYCQFRNYHLVLLHSPMPSDDDSVLIPVSCVSDSLSLTSSSQQELPADVASCRLPVVKGDADNLIRSGLCSSVRYIVLQAQKVSPDEKLDEILGFRGGTLKSCAEVSSWTRLCEVDIPASVQQLRDNLKCLEYDHVTSLVLPSAIERLEKQMRTPVLLHNDDKKKQEVLCKLRKTFTEASLRIALQNCSTSGNISERLMGILQQGIVKEHCVTRFRILREFHGIHTVIPEKKKQKKKNKESRRQRLAALRKSVNNTAQDPQQLTARDVENVSDSGVTSFQSSTSGRCHNGISTVKGATDCDLHTVTEKTEMLSIGGDPSIHGDHASSNQSELLSHVVLFLHSLTVADIHLDHNYAEGINLTLADLLLFVFIHFFLEFTIARDCSIQSPCPKVLQWYYHMTSLPRVRQAAENCGMAILTELSTPKQGREITSARSPGNNEPSKKKELSHHSKGTYKPLKPDVANALSKLKTAGIQPTVGEHPCGQDIRLPWSEFPQQVHPFDDNLPKSRSRGKCEQLENLASAVVKIARPGQVIVDFCSGGGHFGIVIAYLLPDCQVYLIENKEESIMRSKHRVDSLGLRNVTLFQCNLDYFNGQFDIGVCLHGCGVATDMVLQKCLDIGAAFVVCPCCYGKVQNTHSITYPRSEVFREAQLTAKEYIILGHAADQTEVGIDLEEQGKYCSNLVDTDRGMLFQQYGYTVTLCSLQPVTCTTKNNLLIGVPPVRS